MKTIVPSSPTRRQHQSRKLLSPIPAASWCVSFYSGNGSLASFGAADCRIKRLLHCFVNRSSPHTALEHRAVLVSAECSAMPVVSLLQSLKNPLPARCNHAIRYIAVPVLYGIVILYPVSFGVGHMPGVSSPLFCATLSLQQLPLQCMKHEA
ncbi:hypothetical protein EDC01DRAFT_654322 [Geopyxis carbonaria]|nr:hypothetical protein EDC01DRAFT_654322 [Geopyxis carbonaria]